MSQQNGSVDRVKAGDGEEHLAPRSRGMAISVWLRDLVISLAISGFIIIFVYQPVKVEGTSMMPSLEELYQTGDWTCWRPHPHKCRPGVGEWQAVERGLRAARLRRPPIVC